jgi:type II secretory pathway pseudopilin PulG
MIVIAVIGILAAVMFPTVSGYMDRAKDVTIRSQLKMFATAIEVYAVDREDYRIL